MSPQKRVKKILHIQSTFFNHKNHKKERKIEILESAVLVIFGLINFKHYVDFLFFFCRDS